MRQSSSVSCRRISHGCARLLLSCAACILLTVTQLSAQDWPHWRGPDRNGTSTATSGWSNTGWLNPEPIWQQQVFEGSSAPLVVDDKVLVTGWKDGTDILQCLAGTDGKVLWQAASAAPKFGRLALGDQGLYGGPTSAPEYDPETGLLYTLSCDGDLQCRDTRRDGALIWQVQLHDRYQVQQRPRVGRSGHRDYGFTTAPLLHGNWLIVEVGATSGTVVAFQKDSGAEAWKSAASVPAGHTGGLVPMTVDEIPCLAVMTFQGLLVLRLDADHAGSTVAEHEWITSFANNVATPAVFRNSVLITSAYNHNAIARIDVSLTGAQEVWKQPYASKVCTPVIHDGNIYWAWQQLHCLNFATGEQKWAGGQWGDAGSCILTSDERLIVWGDQGKLGLVETARRSPDEYQELEIRNRVFNSDAWPHVAFAGNRLFCRDRKGNMACFELK